MFQVAVTDYTFPSLDLEEGILQSAGCEVRAGQCKTPDTLIPLVADADEPIGAGDQVVAGKTLALSLTFDHRVVDGAPAAGWLQQLGHEIQQLVAI